MKAQSLNLNFKPATPKRWADLEELFGERGACGGCWCMYWRLPRSQWTLSKGHKNRTAFQEIVAQNRQPGVIAYLERKPIGWCAIAPREEFIALAKSRVLKPIDDEARLVDHVSVREETFPSSWRFNKFAASCGGIRCEKRRALCRRLSHHSNDGKDSRSVRIHRSAVRIYRRRVHGGRTAFRDAPDYAI